MLMKAMDGDDADDITTHAEDVKARLENLTHYYILGRTFESVGAACLFWDGRCQRFYDTYDQAVSRLGQRPASLVTKAKSLRSFMLFLSKVSSHETWNLEREGWTQVWNGYCWDQVPVRNKVHPVNDGPGPLDKHVRLPPEWLVQTFHTIFKKHTGEGQEKFWHEPGVGWRHGTQQFLNGLVERLKFNGYGEGSSRLRRDEWHMQFKQEAFYRLFKDAVIGTLRLGSTVIENYVVNERRMFSIIASFAHPIGVDQNGELTTHYRLLFKPVGENNQLREGFPVFCGMYPVSIGDVHAVAWNVPFDGDNQKWKNIYTPMQ